MIEEPERIVKELWYTVTETSGRSPSVDHATAQAAADAAATMIRNGAYSVSIYRTERLPE